MVSVRDRREERGVAEGKGRADREQKEGRVRKKAESKETEAGCQEWGQEGSRPLYLC